MYDYEWLEFLWLCVCVGFLAIFPLFDCFVEIKLIVVRVRNEELLQLRATLKVQLLLFMFYIGWLVMVWWCLLMMCYDSSFCNVGRLVGWLVGWLVKLKWRWIFGVNIAKHNLNKGNDFFFTQKFWIIVMARLILTTISLNIEWFNSII